MTYRVLMKFRPWLTGAQYDKYAGKATAHFDLLAHTDAFGVYWFEVYVTQSGKTPLAYSAFSYVPEFGIWREVAGVPTGLRKANWTRRTKRIFERVHGRLLALCVTPPGYTARTVLAHYVSRPDVDPWPRGLMNTYRPYQRREGANKGGRPRKARPALLDLL